MPNASYTARTSARRHSKAAHGGQATAAKRRDEEWLMCATCGAPRHPIPRFQARPADTWRDYVGALVTFTLVIFAYALTAAYVIVQAPAP